MQDAEADGDGGRAGWFEYKPKEGESVSEGSRICICLFVVSGYRAPLSGGFFSFFGSQLKAVRIGHVRGEEPPN